MGKMPMSYGIVFRMGKMPMPSVQGSMFVDLQETEMGPPGPPSFFIEIIEFFLHLRGV